MLFSAERDEKRYEEEIREWDKDITGIKERKNWNIKKKPVLIMGTYQTIARYAVSTTFTAGFPNISKLEHSLVRTEMVE